MELKWGHIDNLYKEKDILDYEISVTSKLDGTNCRILIKNDTITIGSHNQLVDMSNPSAHFGFVGWALEHKELFLNAASKTDWDDVYIFGEWIGPGINGKIHYCDEKQFWVFGLITVDKECGQHFHSYDEIKEMLKDVGFNIVPELFRGKVKSEDGLNFFDKLIDQPDLVAKLNGFDSIMEGVVIQPVIPTMNRFGRPLMAKHKSEKFKEIEKGKTPKEYTVNDQMIDNASMIFADTFVTEERINHCIAHARENAEGVINDMADLKFLGKYMVKDIEKEAADALIFADNLIGDRKKINSAIMKRTANIYQKMVKEQYATNL